MSLISLKGFVFSFKLIGIKQIWEKGWLVHLDYYFAKDWLVHLWASNKWIALNAVTIMVSFSSECPIAQLQLFSAMLKDIANSKNLGLF